MLNKNDYAVLLLRNEASLCLDDLTALVTNSTLAFQLRAFSSEIMEMTPGFTFGLKEAKALKKLTADTLRQYQRKEITDVDLMNYVPSANSIIKGETHKNGGDQMSIKDMMHNFINRKDIKKQEAMNKLEQGYREVCEQILELEAEMKRCVAAAKGNAPSSAAYRESERAYNRAESKLKLLKNQEAQLGKVLEEAGRRKLIEQYADEMKAIASNTNLVLGDDAKLSRSVAEAEFNVEKTEATLARNEGIGESLFAALTEDSPKTNSAFGAAVAADERRDAIFESLGEAAPNTAASVSNSAFGALVSEEASKQ